MCNAIWISVKFLQDANQLFERAKRKNEAKKKWEINCAAKTNGLNSQNEYISKCAPYAITYKIKVSSIC